VASMKQSSILQGVAQKGSVLQVVSTTKTDTFSSTSSSAVAITGLAATITPSSTTSKIEITTTINYGYSGTTTRGRYIYKRNLVDVGIGDAAGSRLRTTGAMVTSAQTDAFAKDDMGSVSGQFLDSPGLTSAIVYSVDLLVHAGTLYINRPDQTADDSGVDRGRTISTITVKEVAG